MKVVTICGSMRFAKEMQKVAWELEAKNGYVVIQCVYNDRETKETDEEILNIVNAHWKKIDISDAIYVVNIGGYIGESTKKEIECWKRSDISWKVNKIKAFLGVLTIRRDVDMKL